MRRSIAGAVVLSFLAAPVGIAAAQTFVEPFELSGCGTASCHTIRGRLTSFTPALTQNFQYSVFVDFVSHTFTQPGYVRDTPLGGGVIGTLPDGSATEPWVEIVSGCGFQSPGSTCTRTSTEQGVRWSSGSTWTILPIVTPLHITQGYVDVVLLPESFTAPPGTSLTYGPPIPGQQAERVHLALVTPEPGTWALLGTGLIAVGGLAQRRRRTV